MGEIFHNLMEKQSQRTAKKSIFGLRSPSPGLYIIILGVGWVDNILEVLDLQEYPSNLKLSLAILKAGKFQF